MKTLPAGSKTPSSLLKELSDRTGILPGFTYNEETKVGEVPRFTCAVKWEGKGVGRGSGQSKKQAKQEACLKAIKTLSNENPYKSILSELYNGATVHPVVALQQLSQSSHIPLRFESPSICKVYWNEEMISCAEGPNQPEAKRLASQSALNKLNSEEDSIPSQGHFHPVIEENTENPAYETYLRSKDLDLALSAGQIREVQAVIVTVNRWKSLLNSLGVREVSVIGSAVTGTMRRNRVIVDVGLVIDGDIDLERCLIALTSQFIDTDGRKVSYLRVESGRNSSISVILKARNTFICCFNMSGDSYILSYLSWLQEHSLSPAQSSILRLLKHWKSIKTEKRDIPGEVLDWIVLSQVSGGMTVGAGFRKVMEWLAGGGLLAGRERELEEWVVRAMEGKEAEAVETAREAFVTMVQLSRDSVSTLL